MNIAILCGGKGTRLKTVSKGKPKILIPIENQPFIYLLLDSLINNGFKKIFLLTSYKSDFIKKEIGNKYKDIPIIIIEDNKNLKNGTSSALLNAIEYLPDHFLLQYGDTILDIDYEDFYNNSQFIKDKMLMAIYANKKNLDKNNIFFKKDKLNYFNSEFPENKEKIKSANFIDYGLLGLHKSFLNENLNFLKENESLKNFQQQLSFLDLIKPYIVQKRFYEIGTPESYEEFKNLLSKGTIKDLIYLKDN